MYERPFYLLLGLLALLLTLFQISDSIWQNWQQANASPLAEISHQKKANALHQSIQRALLANNEPITGYTSTPCTAQIDMSRDESNETADTSIEDGLYHCTVTASSGNVYDAEIELLVINGEIWDMPALLTRIESDNHQETL